MAKIVTRRVPSQESGELTVTRTSKKVGIVADESGDSEAIKVGIFKTEPAFVEVGHGATLNLGDYESCRVEVRVRIPCYVEEISEILPIVSDIAFARLVLETDAVRKEK